MEIMKKETLMGVEEAAERMIGAAKKNERIIVYGDADLDGVSSAIILKESLEILNKNYTRKNLKVYFPDRENEGYGITFFALEFFKNFSPGIFFALDCGISNFKEIELAKKMGFFVIVVDHHRPLKKLPKANLIINPCQPKDKTSFKQFSAAGLVYKLARYALIKNQSVWQPEKFLELVALATLADQMPIVEENRQLTDEGLKAFKYTERLGLKTLKEITQYQEGDSIDLFQKIISPLNSSDRVRNFTETYMLLTTRSKRTSLVLARNLFKKSTEKKKRIQEIFDEVLERIKNKNSPIIFEGDKSWPTIMIGVVASKLCQIYHKPIFLFKITEEECVGSARLPKGIDGVEAMENCKKLLTSYGGHPPACGCRLKVKNFEKLKNCLIRYFQ